MEVRHVRDLLHAISHIDDTVSVSQSEPLVRGGAVANIGAAEQLEGQAGGGRVIELEPTTSCDTTTHAELLHVVAGDGDEAGGTDGHLGGEPELPSVTGRTSKESSQVEIVERVIYTGREHGGSGGEGGK